MSLEKLEAHATAATVPQKYGTVNGQWPENSNEGRLLKPSPQEAITGAKRLYRLAMGKPWRGPVKLVTGRKRTWIRYGVMLVNPDEGGGPLRGRGAKLVRAGGGWHEIVHSISHWAALRLYNEGHGYRHAFIERELIKAVISGGWHQGALLRKRAPRTEPAPGDKLEAKRSAIEAKIKRWQSKAKRAQTALRKLARQKAYYDRKLGK